MDAEPGATQESEKPSRTARTVGAIVLLAVALFVALVLLDLWVTRSDAQRDFIASNIECLRCHTELLPRLDDPEVHQPFVTSHCTSCHIVHAQRGTSTVHAGDFSAWRWLRLTLDRLALDFVWRLLAGSGLVGEREPSADASSETSPTQPAALRTSEAEVCWTCHADLAPDLFAQHVHEPFAAGQCTSCHDPHSSQVAMLLQGEAEDVCVSCHRIGPDLLDPEVHLPFGERQCIACHNPHSSEYAGILAAEERELCFGCHGEIGELAGEPVQHEPFEGACTQGCHLPHTAQIGPLLTAAPPALCYECHEEVEPQFSLVSAHPVPERLNCPDCHTPHASGFEGLLPVAQRELCVGCHDGVREDLALPVIHEPVAEDVCTSCHTPHGSDTAPLLEAALPQLCYGCHPDKPPKTLPARTVKAGSSSGAKAYRKKGRPIDEESAMSLPPARWGGERPRGTDPITLPYRRYVRLPSVPAHPMDGTAGLLCSDCHRAHSSENALLFPRPGNALCRGCHGRDLAEYTYSAHGGLQCVRCHSIHRPKSAPVLGVGNPGVCLQCHSNSAFGEGNGHPASQEYYDTYANEPLTCTSTCHDPHGSRFVTMLRVPYNSGGYGSDYVCLICHRQVGVVY